MLPPVDELPPVPESDDEHEVPPAESTGMEVDSVAAGGMEYEEAWAHDEQGSIVLSPTEPFDPVQAKATFELRMCGEPPAVPESSASSASGSADGPVVLGRERPFV
jgi:hypothetical protein